MKKRKVCIVITTRGNYAKTKSIMEYIAKDPELELQVIVGGGAILPKYGNVISSLNAQMLKINRVIYFLVEGENPVTMAKSAGLAVTEFSTAFENMRPDVVLVIADRFESLAIAMAACYMNISLAHLEGGETSGSIDESVRHAVTKLSHLHFPATAAAAQRIRQMGEDPNTIFPVGCTSFDVINELDLGDIRPIVELQKTIGVGAIVDMTKPYLVAIQHPVTTEYKDTLLHVKETIEAIDSLGINTFWLWPNMDAGSDGVSSGLRTFRERKNPRHVHFFKSLPIEYYAPLLYNAACIVGNSSSGIREAAFMGVPCVNIGSRQKGRERGKNVLDTDYDCRKIIEAIKRQLPIGRYPRSYVYGRGDAGKKIAKILHRVDTYCQKKITY